MDTAVDLLAQITTPGFAAALATIVLLDLVLAGDNAIVIGLAARNVPAQMQRRVIFWGMAGAIVTRALLTLVVVWLLRIPGFLLGGGLALVWIANSKHGSTAGAGRATPTSPDAARASARLRLTSSAAASSRATSLQGCGAATAKRGNPSSSSTWSFLRGSRRQCCRLRSGEVGHR